MEAEMEQVFELKVKEKINRLNDSETGKSDILKKSLKVQIKINFNNSK